MGFKIVHADLSPDVLAIECETLAAVGLELVCAEAKTPEQIIQAGCDADVLMTYDPGIPRRIVQELGKAQAIISYGIGFDHIDTDAATEHGILVVNTPGFCIDEVANHALMLLLALTKKLVLLDRRMRQGQWTTGRELREVLPPTPPIYGQQLGLVGFGAIARNVALKAQSFGLTVGAYDPLIDPAVFDLQHVTRASLQDVLTTSDYVSLHVPLTPETRHLLNEHNLRSMKPSAYLINTSRGSVVDEPALIQALQAGWIAGAGLDVFEQEPLAGSSPLLAMDNVIVTPHTASYSEASRVRVRRRVAEEAARIARGEWPTALANPQVRGRSRFEQRLSN